MPAPEDKLADAARSSITSINGVVLLVCTLVGAALSLYADLFQGAAPAPHVVANALAAAALARSHGVSQEAVRAGLMAFQPDGHRIALVGQVEGLTWIDDSKATNPHAAAAAIRNAQG